MSEALVRTQLRGLYAMYADDKRLRGLRAEAGGVLVPGDGPVRPQLMLVGEAPGGHEAAQRRPFVGASGALLDEMLASVGLDRGQVFLTNMVKYRPKDNREPMTSELQVGLAYLRREHNLLGSPPMVVLGKHLRRTVEWGHRLPHGLTIGEWAWMKRDGGYPVLPLYHPAYGIYQRSNRPVMFEQFKAVLSPPTEAPDVA